MLLIGHFMLSATRWAEAPATSRHTHHPLWLLPSGSDQVHELVLREDQGLHRFEFGLSPKRERLLNIDMGNASDNPDLPPHCSSTEQHFTSLIKRCVILLPCWQPEMAIASIPP